MGRGTINEAADRFEEEAAHAIVLAAQEHLGLHFMADEHWQKLEDLLIEKLTARMGVSPL